MNDPKVTRNVLAVLNKKHTPINRVASRWLTANQSKIYDQMIRLQILEGVARVPEGSWWKTEPAQRGFDKAHESFKDSKINPEWLSLEDTGVYTKVAHDIRQAILKMHLDVDVMDIIHGMLFNFSLASLASSEELKAKKNKEDSFPIPYNVGTYLALKIKNGEEKPAKVGGMVGYHIYNRLITQSIKEKQDVQQVDNETLAKTPGEVKDAYDLLMNLIFAEPGNKISQYIRNMMRNSWKGTYAQEAMDYWLDNAEKGIIIDKNDLADRMGIGRGTFHSNHWKKAWRLFMDKLWRDTKLLNYLQIYFEAQGVKWFQNKPDPVALLPLRINRKKYLTTSDILGKIS